MTGQKSAIRQFGGRAMALLAVLLVAGCLPDSESAREKKLAQFAQNEAAGYAAALSSYLTTSRANLAANAAYQDGTLASGLIGQSSDGRMAHGYCVSGPANNRTRMLVAWYNSQTDGANFAMKGLGEGAGAAIVNALSLTALPETIGYFRSNRIELRGQNEAGQTRISLPSGCALSIPSGAPVMISQNIAAPLSESVEADSLVIKTEKCADDDIGYITYQCYKTAKNACSPDSNVGWKKIDETCNGAVSTRSVTITRAKDSLVGAMNFDAGKLNSALNNLKDMECANVEVEETVKDDNGKDVVTKTKMANSCGQKDLKVKEYTGPGENEVMTNQIVKTETLEASCGGDAPGTTNSRVNYGSTVYSGKLSLQEWKGKVTYIRNVYKSVVDRGDAGTKHGNTLVRGKWEGNTLSCSRAETMVISCNTMFPSYKDTAVYQVVSSGGVTLKRNNRVSGWKDKKALTPNDPYSRDESWSLSAVNCSWDQLRTFNCPSGYTLVQAGQNKRRITVTKGNLMSPTVADWRKSTPLKCQKIKKEEKACPNGS